MKLLVKFLTIGFILHALPGGLRAQIPVTDVANLANNTLAHVENIAKWVESIAQLKTQINQLDLWVAKTSSE